MGAQPSTDRADEGPDEASVEQRLGSAPRDSSDPPAPSDPPESPAASERVTSREVPDLGDADSVADSVADSAADSVADSVATASRPDLSTASVSVPSGSSGGAPGAPAARSAAPGDVRARWPLVTARAAVTLAFGAVALVTPEIALGTLALAFGVFAIVEGVLLLVDAVRVAGSQRPLLAVQGVLGAAAGLAALVWPSPSLVVVVALVGSWAVASGVVEVAAALAAARGVPSSYVAVLAGVTSVTVGVLLFGRQDLELPGVAVLVGAFAFGAGSMLLASAMRLRQLPRP